MAMSAPARCCASAVPAALPVAAQRQMTHIMMQQGLPQPYAAQLAGTLANSLEDPALVARMRQHVQHVPALDPSAGSQHLEAAGSLASSQASFVSATVDWSGGTPQMVQGSPQYAPLHCPPHAAALREDYMAPPSDLAREWELVHMGPDGAPLGAAGGAECSPTRHETLCSEIDGLGSWSDSYPLRECNSGDLAELDEIGGTQNWQSHSPSVPPTTPPQQNQQQQQQQPPLPLMQHPQLGPCFAPFPGGVPPTYLPPTYQPASAPAAAAEPLQAANPSRGPAHQEMREAGEGSEAEAGLAEAILLGPVRELLKRVQSLFHSVAGKFGVAWCLTDQPTGDAEADEEIWHEKLVAGSLFLLLVWVYSDSLPRVRGCKQHLREGAVRLVASLLRHVVPVTASAFE
eukprot:TRINITY_DN8896_c4_g1_i1.p1 TRINITY_DN8896_c4_g1~~TRINITY_DN8896_c4_g1_i1.p1  ORF type:complete len:402 (+),score=101.91 TRINITY_DN8896_c4_g1_i1:105-1310(+)